jgi:hypothetical protein
VKLLNLAHNTEYVYPLSAVFSPFKVKEDINDAIGFKRANSSSDASSKKKKKRFQIREDPSASWSYR